MKFAGVTIFAIGLSVLSGSTVLALATQPIAPDQAKRLVSFAMADFQPRVGQFLVRTFNDLPRQTVPANSPIVVRVGDSRLGPVPGVYSNCFASSAGRYINCDLGLLDDLIDGYALIYQEDQRQAVRGWLLQIVLAHELGHIMLHHGLAAYHGSADGFSIERYAAYKIENEADAYGVQLMDQLASDHENEYGEIVDLASGALKKSVCPKTFPKPCPCPGYTDWTLCSRVPLGPGLVIAQGDPVPVTLQGTHPEFVVRFARQLFISTDPTVQKRIKKEAQQILSQVVVRDEAGKLQSTSPTFSPPR